MRLPWRPRTPRPTATPAAPSRSAVHRGFAIISIPILLAAAGLLATQPAQAAVACRVDYTVSSSWPGGFGANVTINNLGDAVNGWRLTWSFGGGQQITQIWNATQTQSGSTVTATNVGYNAAIPSGGSTSFGFNGSYSGSNPSPTSFSLNGVACTGTPDPTVTPTPNPTPTPTPTPTGTCNLPSSYRWTSTGALAQP
ncbi:cellulose binding domain-containing protein, partial [Streptosporangium sp. G11]|uniref:cellulose-binding domain-containing protein n=1 Tax=Streptosporangium sp. G11 TaxID=3436926 RepID=UPI003EB8C564